MTQDEMALKAELLFVQGFHCSQAVFAAAAEKLDISPEEAGPVLASLAPFGGGLGSTGDVCGSLPGALAAIGIVTGKRVPEERDGKDMWRLAYRMVQSFGDITSGYGGFHCRDIARVDWTDREQVKKFRTDPSGPRKECLRVIAETARALGEILDSRLA